MNRCFTLFVITLASFSCQETDLGARKGREKPLPTEVAMLLKIAVKVPSSIVQPGYDLVKPVLDSHCVSCHHLAYLDLRTYPFPNDRGMGAAEVAAELVRRTEHQSETAEDDEGEEDSLQPMPPTSCTECKPVSTEDLALLRNFARSGARRSTTVRVPKALVLHWQQAKDAQRVAFEGRTELLVELVVQGVDGEERVLEWEVVDDAARTLAEGKIAVTLVEGELQRKIELP
jgi:hypothetical protein